MPPPCNYSVELSGTCIGTNADIYEWTCSGPWAELNLGNSCGLLAGNPVNVGTGNKFQHESDLSSGITPMSLSFDRYYNSQDRMPHALGFAWTHSYGMHLSFADEQYPTVIATRKDGKLLLFKGENLDPHPGVKERLSYDPENETFVLTLSNGTRETYDGSGRLTTITALNTNTQTLTYVEEGVHDGLLERVADPFGRSISFTYNASNLMETLTDPAGTTIRYTYDADDNLIQVVYQDDTARTYHYEDPNDTHNLTGITDERGVRYATYAYDDQDRAISSSHASGADKVQVDYHNGSASQRTVLDANGNAGSYTIKTMDGLALPQTVTGGCSGCGGGESTNYTYNADHTIQSETRDGVKTAYTRDDLGNILTRTRAGGTVDERITTYTYVPNTRLQASVSEPSTTQGQLKTTTYGYDDLGNRIQMTESGFAGDTPYSRVTTWHYNAHGQVTLMDGPLPGLQDAATFTYDDGGNLVSTTAGDLLTTTYEDHDAFGNPGRRVDPNGHATLNTYDLRGRLLTTITDAGTTQYTYDSMGNLVRVDPPGGGYLIHTYDDARRLVSTTNALGEAMAREYDAAGNRIKETILDAQGSVTHTLGYEYDAANRLIRTVYPDLSGEERTYDTQGNPATTRDANGRVTTFDYDGLNRLISVTRPGEVITSYAYDGNGNLVSVTDGENRETTYSFDDAGQVMTIVSPDTGTTDHGYDEAGRLTFKTTNSGKTTFYLYDGLGRITKTQTESETTTFTYDGGTNGMGRLTNETGPGYSYDHAYDAMGNPMAVTQTVNGVSRLIGYAHDANGNLTAMTYPDGRTLTFEYDILGRQIRVTTHKDGVDTLLASGIGYIPFGPANAMTLGNSIPVEKEFDHRRQPSRIRAGTVLDLQYARDTAGNITAITDLLDTTRNQTFEYDELDRLVSAQGIYGNYGYTYDKTGNRRTRSMGSLSETYAYEKGTNRIKSVRGEVSKLFVHDADGNVKNVIEANRSPSALDQADYLYNASGQRIRKTVDGVTTIYHYAPNGNLIAETDAYGNQIKSYVWLHGRPLAMIDADQNVCYVHNDHLGTPRKMTNAAGTVVWAADYRPFGEVDITTAAVENNLRFPGQYYDSETGLHYNWNRYYDPKIGRYSTPDPAGINGGIDLYLYANCNPLRDYDYEGLACKRSTDWEPITVLTNSNSNEILISSIINKKWRLARVWDVVPMAYGTTNSALNCACEWKPIGCTRKSLYEKPIPHKATFKCDNGDCREWEETRYKDLYKRIDIEEDISCLFSVRNKITYGIPSGQGCSCENVPPQ
ncbi:MAG: RHS repeat protein [Desulfobacterium sp.]|nr:RHS repeat protein [Desulfobacterium sp.]